VASTRIRWVVITNNIPVQSTVIGDTKTPGPVRARLHIYNRGPFAPFGSPKFRLFSAAMLVSSTAVAIQTLARIWIVQDTTHSPLLVAAVSAATGLPILILGFFGGYLADRFSRKWISVVGEVLSFVVAAGLAALAMLEIIQVWHIMLASGLQGITTALVISARQTLITDLVPENQQRGAIGLSMLVANVSGIIGPGAAGALIPNFGTDIALVAGAAVALVGIILFLWLKISYTPVPDQKGTRMWADVVEGVRYVIRMPRLRWLMLCATIMLVMISSRGAVFPPLVQDVLGRGAAALGMMEMVGGVGAVLGPLFAVWLTGKYREIRIETVTAIMFAVSVALLAISPWFSLTLFLSGAATFLGTIFFAANLSAIQLGAPANLRGRVISVRFVLSGTHPMGIMALGALAQLTGPREALFAFAVIGIVLVLVLNVVLPAKDNHEPNGTG
jgi:MFS family permease